ncbi:MAG: hypothetical protein R3F22_09270 [Lysobacteraceae bacterium]
MHNLLEGQMLDRDRDFTLCATGLTVGALAPLVSVPESALVSIAGYMVALWFWPWRESKGSFGRMAFPILIGCVAVTLVLAPLARDGWVASQTALFAVKIIFLLLQLEALFYIGGIWWQGRAKAN